MGVMVFLSNNKVNWVSEHSLMVGGVQEEPKVNKSPRSWTGRILILDMLVLFFNWDVRPTEGIRRETAFDKGWIMMGKEEQM